MQAPWHVRPRRDGRRSTPDRKDRTVAHAPQSQSQSQSENQNQGHDRDRNQGHDQAGGPFATPRTAAGVLYFDGPEHVLLVHPTYKEGWDLPGGYLMPGETPTSALRRELLEELGADLPIGELLVVDWAPSEREGDKVLFVFDGGELTEGQRAAIRVDGVEIDRYAYHHTSALDGLLIPRPARRVHVAVRARANGGETVYLEHGARLGQGFGGGRVR